MLINNWWKKIVVYVDINTGEVLERKKIKNKEYKKIKKTVSYEKYTKTKNTIYECKRNQLGIFER
jgi:hypothetical protein